MTRHHTTEPPRSRRDGPIAVIFGALLIGFAFLRARGGTLGWRNYAGQPVTVYLVGSLGFILVAIGLLDHFVWRHQRAAEHAKRPQ